MSPLGTYGHFNGEGKPVYAKESKVRCPRCPNRYAVSEEKISRRHSIFTCSACGSTWDAFKEKRSAPPSKPKPPPKPTGPSYSSPAARAAVAGEPSGPLVGESED